MVYSLIYDLEEKSDPIGTTAVFDLGTVISRLSRDWVVIGSGEKLGDKDTYKIEEIRCIVLRRDDLNAVREVFKKWSQKGEKLESGKEIVIEGLLDTKDSTLPIIQKEGDDTLISVIYKEISIQARFAEENLKFIKGIDLEQDAALRGTEVYVCGLVIQTESNQWEILGRSLLPVKES